MTTQYTVEEMQIAADNFTTILMSGDSAKMKDLLQGTLTHPNVFLQLIPFLEPKVLSTVQALQIGILFALLNRAPQPAQD